MKPVLIALVGLLGLLQFKLWFQHDGVALAWHLHHAVVAQQTENHDMRDRNTALAAEVVDLKQGVAAVEERARTEMGMVKNGETFYQIVQSRQNF